MNLLFNSKKKKNVKRFLKNEHISYGTTPTLAARKARP